jgi:hypothetical protein
MVLENLAWDADHRTFAMRHELRPGIGTGLERATGLKTGRNCLAVELHRGSPFATDVSLALRLSIPSTVTITAWVNKHLRELDLPAGSGVQRAALRFPRSDATANLRMLRSSAEADASERPRWTSDTPLYFGHDRGSRAIEFDVTDLLRASLEAPSDGLPNWVLLNVPSRADALNATHDDLDAGELFIWVTSPLSP